MPPRCFCGALFSTHSHLLSHVEAKGHRFQCSCGSLFKELPRLLIHQTEARHSWAPTHTELQPLVAFAGSPQLDDVAANVCAICHRSLANADGVSAHRSDVHPECPTCHQVFAARDQRLSHQKASGHCYCDQHNIAFGDARAAKAHERAEVHVTGFECIPCDRPFGNQQALDDHLILCELRPTESTPAGLTAVAAATFAAFEEANLHCQSCNRDFIDLNALRQHKKSVIHEPITDLECPAPNCKKAFTSISALLFHAESGTCKSGINRQKLNDMVHLHDTDRHITYASNSRASISGSRSSIAGSTYDASLGSADSNLTCALDRLSLTPSNHSRVISEVDESDAASTVTSLGSGVRLTPDGSDASNTNSSMSGFVLTTPSASSAASRSSSSTEVIRTPSSSSRASSEWSFLNSGHALTPQSSSVDGSSVSTVTYDTVRRVWPCNLCNKTFLRKSRLLQHLNSPAHAVKLFHCPPAAVLGLAAGKPPKAFKTLSGFAQHLESGACSGGRETLNTIVRIVEGRFTAATGQNIRLLRNS